MKEFQTVVVESPFAGDVARNIAYAQAALRDCLLRGEAPFASHLLYTQEGILDDNDPLERLLGIDAGLAWSRQADKTVVYNDYGISKGMQYGIDYAKSIGRSIEFRTLPDFVATWTSSKATQSDQNASPSPRIKMS